MFCHTHRPVSGMSLPSWLKLGPIYVTRHIHNLVDEAQRLRSFCFCEKSGSVLWRKNVGTDVPDFETYVGSKLRANVENEPNGTVNDIDENPENESRKSIDETMM